MTDARRTISTTFEHMARLLQEVRRSLHATLQDKGIRLVVAQVMDEVRTGSRYGLGRLLGEDAFFDSLADVIAAYETWREKGTEKT